MGFLPALLYGAGGFAQGRRQRTQDQQQADIIAQQSKEAADRQRIADATEGRAEEANTRAGGTDPATGKPFVLPKNLAEVAPGNKGVPASLQQQIDHLVGYGQWLNQTRRDGSGDPFIQRASQLQTEIMREQNENATTNRELTMFGLRDAATDRRQKTTLDAETDRQLRGEGFQTGQTERHEDYTSWQGDVNQARRDYSAAQRNVESARAAMTGEIAKLNGANKPAVTDKNNNVTPAVTKNPNMAQYENTLHAIVEKALSGKGGPEYISQKIDDFSKNPNLSQDQIDTAIDILSRVGDAVRQTQEAHQSLSDIEKQRPQFSSGGSDASGNPTKGGATLPQRTIWNMLIENGATPEEATTLAAVAYAESGGNPGSVNPKDNGGKQTSWGLFQISDGTHNEPAGWDDPETNTQMAIAKLRSQGLKAWGTYDSGAYRRFLPKEQVAAQ